jgi:mitochondrial fission protein ELM1
VNRKRPRIWVLLGSRRGDNNQLLALAEALGMPFETRTLSYRRTWALLLNLLPKRPHLLTARARLAFEPPWPDLILGIGRRSVAVSRWIRKRSGKRAKIVRVGNPRAATRLFDLVITTNQYPVPDGENVLRLPVAMGRHTKPPQPTDAEAQWLGSLPRPHLLFAVGGTTRYWKLPGRGLVETLKRLHDRAKAKSGSLVVVTSPRTPAWAVEAIRNADTGCNLIADGSIRYSVLLADSDENFVTADSVSMISEAILTGNNVGLVPVELDREGHRRLGDKGFSDERRDLRRFWADLEKRGLVGTVDQPTRGNVEDPVKLAAAAVTQLLGDGFE